MDLSQIKNKLAGLQPKPKYEKVDYSKVYWKPKIGKHQVRIVPSKFDKSNPFKELYFHYGFGKFTIAALTNWGEQDPIVEFSKGLRKSSDKEDWQMAKKIEPKMRVFVPVLVRGEEHMGVRLWEFGKEIYQQLLGIATDEDYGDYTDISDGRDFTVEATEGEVAGRKVVKCAIRVKPKTTPISEDATQLEKFLSEQPDIMTLYRKHTFEELKVVLQKWLNPEEDIESIAPVVSTPSQHKNEDEEAEPLSDLPFDQPASKTYSLDTSAGKTSSADKFDSLFNQD
jgi:hypothetical protein